MSTIDATTFTRALVDDASAPYRRAGRFAWRFARGKLRFDPVFAHLLARGAFARGTHVFDVGCGQGLLASIIAAAADAARRGRWPRDWAAPPLDVRVSGIELAPREVARARAALGPDCDIACADMRSAVFPHADTIVLLDVLHYVERAAQDDVLSRARQALAPDGTLVLRVADAAARARFAATLWIDRIVAVARGRGTAALSGRTAAEWQARLERLGFAVASAPMSTGTPFANVLFVATLATSSRNGAERLGATAVAHA